MRRHRDIDVGLAPLVRHIKNGLDGIFPDSAVVSDNGKILKANNYMAIAYETPPFNTNSSSWQSVRGRWKSYLGVGDNDASGKTIGYILDAINKDVQNPSFTSWDNTALGSIFADALVSAFTNQGWALPAYDSKLKKVGNKMALNAYKSMNKDIWPLISSSLSSGPVNQYSEYLSDLGISNPSAKPVSYWVANPGYKPQLDQHTTHQDTAQVTIQPPPFDYGKLNATGLALRDGPSASASSIKTLPNPPLYAKVIGVSGGFVKVQLMDGTIGWTASGSDTKAYWLPSSQDEAFGNKQTVVTTNQNVPATQLTPGDVTTVTQYQDPNAGLPVPVAPVSPEPLVAPVAPAPPETSNTAMYIVVGVGVLVIGGLALMLLKKKD